MTSNLDLCIIDHLLLQVRLIYELLHVSIYWLSKIFRRLLLWRNIDSSKQPVTIRNWVTFCGIINMVMKYFSDLSIILIGAWSFVQLWGTLRRSDKNIQGLKQMFCFRTHWQLTHKKLHMEAQLSRNIRPKITECCSNFSDNSLIPNFFIHQKILRAQSSLI